MLKKKLEEKEQDVSPPLIMSETPKPSVERGHSLRDNKRCETSNVYQSLKQEIKELNYQVGFPP